MSVAYVPTLITIHNLPSELIPLITMSFNAKQRGEQPLSSSLAISATECFIAAFPDLGVDVRAIARKVRRAADIAKHVAGQVDQEVGLVLAALFFLRRSNKFSVWQLLHPAKIQAMIDLRRLFGVGLSEAREVVQYGS